MPDDDRVAVVTVPALLSVATVAQLLDVSERTVRRRISDGSLLAVVEHGRVMIRADELRGYVDSLERPCGTAHSRRRRPPARHDYGFLHE